jgi:hypothetical protein
VIKNLLPTYRDFCKNLSNTLTRTATKLYHRAVMGNNGLINKNLW